MSHIGFDDEVERRVLARSQGEAILPAHPRSVDPEVANPIGLDPLLQIGSLKRHVESTARFDIQLFGEDLEMTPRSSNTKAWP